MQRWIDVSGTPGHPIDKDIQTYPSVHLTGPHECDPSVLDYVHPEDNGEPDFLKDFNLTQTLMNLVILSTDHSLFLTYWMMHSKFHQLITYWSTNMYLNKHQLIMKVEAIFWLG